MSWACEVVACAAVTPLLMVVGSISASSCPRLTGCPSSTSTLRTTPIEVKLTAVASLSSTMPT